MATPSLPISTLINVTSSLAAAAVQAQSTNTLLIVGTSTVIPLSQRMQTFASATEVATAFGPSAPETIAATIWFNGSPQPTSVDIGRWAQAAAAGQLIGAPLTVAQQMLSVFTAITDGGFGIALNGTAVEQVTALNFSAAANLNAVASIIQTALTGTTVVWNGTQFVITSSTTGASSAVSFATSPTGEGVTDISTMLGLSATSSGAFTSPGQVAESALAAVTILDNMFGNQFYGISVLGAADTDVQAIVPFITASTNKHYYFDSTMEAGVLVPTFTTDIASVLKAANLSKVAVQYNGSTPFSAIALASKMLSVNYAGANTVIAAMWQNEPSVTADSLSLMQLNSLTAKNANAFVRYNNGASIVIPGVSSSGQFIDTVIGADALALAIQTNVFNLFFSGVDIPQDDAGMHLIKVAGIQPILTQFVANGFIAPGIWNNAGFGSLAQGNNLPNGYYIFQPLVATQTAAQRQARISVPFQIAVNLAGAVATVNVAITLGS
jgi:hypothetical protein